MSKGLVSWARFDVAAGLLAASDTGTGTDSGIRSSQGQTVAVADTAAGTDIANVFTGGNQAKAGTDRGFGFSRYAAAGLIYLFRNGELLAPVQIGGTLAKAATDSGAGTEVSQLFLTDRTFAVADTAAASDTSSKSPPTVVPTEDSTPLISFSWTTDPLDPNPVWVDADPYLREFTTKRGRSYEYSRMEAGNGSYVLNNRDRRFEPDYASSPYYPNVVPTRRMRIRATHDQVIYPLFQGFTEGFPQDYPGTGMDATVRQSATDWFYPLNTLKFAGGTTTLAGQVSSTTQTTIALTSVALPLPQAYPFVIQVGAAPDIERMNVTGLAGPSQWTVERGIDTVPRTFNIGDPVRSESVRFAQEQSGTRINNCLDFLGVDTLDRDIDAGNTLIAASDDLVNTAILEHLLLMAECENGRLFVARDGTITFRERHWQFLQELTSRATFGTTIPYLGEGVVLAQDDDKLYNRVKITIADGTVVDAFDQQSINDHMERTLELTWPLASAVEAQDAATWMLSRLKQAQLRIPAVTVAITGHATAQVLATEVAQRYHLVATPGVHGQAVTDTDVIVEGIAHSVAPGRWTATFELSEPDPTSYWRVEVVGASELDETTVPAY
jgi:hypothetical protein